MAATIPAANGGNLLLGRGEIYLDQIVNGVKTGELFLGNCTAFGITTKDEMKEKYTSTKAVSTMLKRTPVHRSVELKIDGDEYNVENMALVLMGNQGTLTQSGSSVTGETVSSSAVLNRYYPTRYRNISAVTVKGGVSGSTALTAGTDYIVDPDGRIYIASGGTVAAGDVIKVDYTYASISGLKKVAGGANQILDAFIRFKGKPTSGPQYEAQCWHVNLMPNGEIGLIADDFGKWALQGLLLDDTLGTYGGSAGSPYYDLIQTA